ncbi:hypothetical protein ACFLY6_00215 [Candidatus Dependentiae bacterium]
MNRKSFFAMSFFCTCLLGVALNSFHPKRSEPLMIENEPVTRQPMRNKNFEAISTSRLCSIETRTDDDYTYIHVFCPDKSECKKIICGGILPHLYPIEETSYNWMTRTKKHKLYQTPLPLPTRSTIFRCITGSSKFGGTLLIDEYNKHMPMWWKLRSIGELKSLISYFNEKAVLNNAIPQNDNILFISVEEYPFLISSQEEEAVPMLSKAEMGILKTYFTVVEDERIIQNCHLFHRTMMISMSKIENSDYKLASNSLRQTIADSLERGYKSLGFKEIALIIISAKVIHLLQKAESSMDDLFKAGLKKTFDALHDFLRGKSSEEEKKE